jgi:hypothetical protein
MDEIDSIGSTRLESGSGGPFYIPTLLISLPKACTLNVITCTLCTGVFIGDIFFFAGDSEVQRTMLELLNQLDGFEPKQNIKVKPLFFSAFLLCFWMLE